MKYCNTCVQPDTRPGIFLDENGTCSACHGHMEKERIINWDERRSELQSMISEIRAGKLGTSYDCIVPVSGGKDSTYQVYMAKRELGLRPLCVTYRTPLRTELGQRNLDNLVKTLGVDLIELTVNPDTERKFVLKALRKAGDCALPEHMGIFAFTLRMAVNFRIPLVIWGESAQLEYGGTKEERANRYLDIEWLRKHGCLQSTTAESWVDDELSLEAMQPFMLPSDDELKAAHIKSIFLGNYVKWDPVHNANVAKSLGFTFGPRPVMGIYPFADLDCKLIVAHHYLKWFKFGMTRTFDNVSTEIRNGRMTRKEAIDWIRKNKDDPIPADHMAAMCEFLGISEKQFFEIIEPFRNLTIWKKNAQGEWFIPGYLEGL